MKKQPKDQEKQESSDRLVFRCHPCKPRGGEATTVLLQLPFFHHFINGAVGSEDALEEDDFVNFLVDVGFLFDGLDDLLEILFFTKIFYSSQSEMRDEVLSIALIANVIECGHNGFFEVKELLRCLLHAEPENAWGVAGAEDAGTVEVHGETLLIFKDFGDSINYFRLVLRWCFANEL